MSGPTSSTEIMKNTGIVDVIWRLHAFTFTFTFICHPGSVCMRHLKAVRGPSNQLWKHKR